MIVQATNQVGEMLATSQYAGCGTSSRLGNVRSSRRVHTSADARALWTLPPLYHAADDTLYVGPGQPERRLKCRWVRRLWRRLRRAVAWWSGQSMTFPTSRISSARPHHRVDAESARTRRRSRVPAVCAAADVIRHSGIVVAVLWE